MSALSDTNPGSVTDPVTGALARRALRACLDGAIAHARRTNGSCSLFLFDLDHFKSINDAYGHARGDAVLQLLAERTTALVGRGGALVRYGGDEFVLILPETDRRQAMWTASRLVNGVKGEPFPGSPPLSVSISLGVATFPDDAADSDELLEIADRRNHLAKRRGRARAVGDDLAVPSRGSAGRLLERETALAIAHGFLGRLDVETRGGFRVIAEAGAGHTRFLTEVTKLAVMRGYEVLSLGMGNPLVRGGFRFDDRSLDDGVADVATRPHRILVVADTDTDWQTIDRRVRELVEREEPRAVVGLLYAVTDPAEKPMPIPLIATVVLSPLSPAALHIWLHAKLRGAPTPALMEWVSKRSGRLIARAERELARLADSGSLEETDGGWDVSPATLARAGHVRRMLPAAVGELIGRERDVTRVADLLSDRRLVTLVGPAGIGKTRLSLAVADVSADNFDDGVAFVQLAGATTTELVASALAEALDISEAADEPLTDTMVRHLRDRSLLLVLDHFQQVLSAGPFVARLLTSAPGVRVLATSWERLRLSGEQVYPVMPLPLPDLDQLPTKPEDAAAALATFAALSMFVTRARQVTPDLQLTPPDIRAAAAVCHCLDGLPLAIELAAANCDLLTPTEILAQLAGRVKLNGSSKDLPGRQRIILVVIDWSFALLDGGCQDLLCGLAAFGGGCSAEAVAAVCAPPATASGTFPMNDRLAILVNKSLIGIEATRAGTRYTMLETIRTYAAERLAASGAEADVHRRHIEYFATLADEAGRETVAAGQPDRYERISRDHHNLRLAFRRAIARGDTVVAARIALGLERYWRTGRHTGEGREWLYQVLAEPTVPGPLHARLSHAAALLDQPS